MKFHIFIALENANCYEYVTEKLLQRLKLYILPVVLGAGNYKYFAPPKSYVNSYDFESATDLAAYLKHLQNNQQEYISYFWWRNYYKNSMKPNYFCDLCRKLNEPGNTDRIQYYKSFNR